MLFLHEGLPMSWLSTSPMLLSTFNRSTFYLCFCLIVGVPYILLPLSYGRVLAYKLRVIESFMSDSDIFASYIGRFGKQRDQQTVAREVFSLTYHWRTYALAVLMNVVVIAAGACASMVIGGISMGLPASFETLIQTAPPTMPLSLGGAYVLNLYDMLKRYRVGDLYPSCLHFHWLHMMVAAVLGPLLAQAFTPSVGRVVAFGIGIFPLKDSLETAKKYAVKRLQLSPTAPAAEGATLNKLQGLTQETIERLEEEGVTSTVHLAYSDPINLLLRTNIPWVILIDLIDQALLFNYLGQRMAELRPLGIRGSIDLAAIAQRYYEDDDEVKRWARIAMHSVGTRLNCTHDEALILSRMLREDGQVDLVWELYTPETPREILARISAEAAKAAGKGGAA